MVLIALYSRTCRFSPNSHLLCCLMFCKNLSFSCEYPIPLHRNVCLASTIRCRIAEKSLHIICVSLNNESVHFLMPHSLKNNFSFSAIPAPHSLQETVSILIYHSRLLSLKFNNSNHGHHCAIFNVNLYFILQCYNNNSCTPFCSKVSSMYGRVWGINI